ncbi:hypothetical protein [Paeniglutamicibacter gangotriensis]|uniref:Uncharacterized protein n=1 Tax=Paeniglutamicibacter gangotriensis Lz1y TaxID=1276920 RepID=M7NLM7_9MICC|nr:hypothetical protein [Paeniglutamicibacter gangotriensis]EMQ99433.1 hypothetical protein ADIAG_01428 [Paeniglutamicibacter gangotriensis Lz1y]
MYSFLLYAASVSPSPVPAADAADSAVPGFASFVATAAVVIITIFLIRDMTRRIRRVRYRGEAQALQQELVEKGKEIQPDEPGDTPAR